MSLHNTLTSRSTNQVIHHGQVVLCHRLETCPTCSACTGAAQTDECMQST